MVKIPSKVVFLTSEIGIVSVNDSFIPPIFKVNKFVAPKISNY